MFRLVFILLMSINILSSNENTVKASELELFLFKVGFESLLKDVEINKDKTSLNSREIKNINEKIELIMAELYKDKRVLFNDTEEKKDIKSIDDKELKSLKNEILFLKEEISSLKSEYKSLKEKKQVVIKKEVVVKEKENKYKKAVVASKFLAVYKRPYTNSKVVRKLDYKTIIQIEKCFNGWCKLANEEEYIRKFLVYNVD